MALVLYIAVDVATAPPVKLPSAMAQGATPGYFVYDKWEGEVGLPGESRAPLRTTLYADNYFRVSVADGAVVFRREAIPPPHIASANYRLCENLLSSSGFRIRRWLFTLEDWDDEDRPFVRVLHEGVGPDGLRAAIAEFNSASESKSPGDRSS